METAHSSLCARAAALAVLLLTLTAGVCQADVDKIYVKFLDGLTPWNGESTDVGRTGWAELDTVSFGADRASSLGGGAAAGTSRPIVIARRVDRLTPQIFLTMLQGAPLNQGSGVADVIIEFTKTVNSITSVFLRIEMRNVVFTKTGSGASPDDADVREEVTLIGGSMRYT